MKINSLQRRILVLCVIALALLWLEWPVTTGPRPAQATEVSSSTYQELAALRLEVTRLKAIAADQSHVMKDVAYHFSNLWFAGQSNNWPLAEFYWSETRSHLHWAVRVIPIRKNDKGEEIRLSEILDPIEKSSLEDIHKAIGAGNRNQFTAAYKQMLESCYSCHIAASKPYLKLQIPRQPEVPIIEF